MKRLYCSLLFFFCFLVVEGQTINEIIFSLRDNPEKWNLWLPDSNIGSVGNCSLCYNCFKLSKDNIVIAFHPESKKLSTITKVVNERECMEVERTDLWLFTEIWPIEKAFLKVLKELNDDKNKKRRQNFQKT